MTHEGVPAVFVMHEVAALRRPSKGRATQR